MRQPIDIDKEQDSLWIRVYSDMRERLRNMSTKCNPYQHSSFPCYIESIYVDDEGLIVVNSIDGLSMLIEEYSDDVMFSLYKTIR